MPVSALQLPQEVWVHIFRFLPAQEKGHIRSTCKFFKRIIDHPFLWRNSTVVLKRIRSYNSQFWTTLRRRKTASVVVHGAGVREWEELAAALPWLTEVAIEQCTDVKALWALRRFSDLKRLTIRNQNCPSGLASALTPMLQLSHLCLCELSGASPDEVIGAVSQLTGLTSLFYHQSDKPISKQTFHGMLTSLPHLKHLSLKMGKTYGCLSEDYFSLPKVNREFKGAVDPCRGELGLTALELLDYADPILSPAAFESLSSLQSLTVAYRVGAKENAASQLKAWLSKLAHLTELSVVRGCRFSRYAGAIPGTLNSLSLTQVPLGPGDMAVLRGRAPGLQQLSLDLGNNTGRSGPLDLAKHFPLLRILKLRHVTDGQFLSLVQLNNLELLVLLDVYPGPSPAVWDLIHKFQDRTNHRVQVVCWPASRDSTACYCHPF